MPSSGLLQLTIPEFHPNLVNGNSQKGRVVQKSIRQKPLRNVPRFIAPMKPTMVPKLPDDRAKWLLEPKLDGYRVVAVKSDGRTNIYSMDANPYTKQFPANYDAVSALFVKDVVLDGEIVAVERTGRPNFNALQNRRSTKLPIYYVAFDCLHFKGRDLLDKPIEERKKYLAEIATGFVSPIQPIFEFSPEVDWKPRPAQSNRRKLKGLWQSDWEVIITQGMNRICG
jgi:ATP-dependent DNA ligase